MRERNAGSSDRGPRRRAEGAPKRPARSGTRGGTSRPTKPKTQRRPPGKPINPEQFLVRQPWSLLEPLLGAGAPRNAMEQLKAYSRLLVEWNRGVSNLISRNDETRFVQRHLAESLGPAMALRDAAHEHVVDLGSGGGLPALPLAIAGVGARWTLVESRRNKTLFLRRACQELGLTQVEVVTARLESVIESSPESVLADGFTSRATLPLGPTLEMAASVVRTGGHAYLWKGSGWKDEIQEAKSIWNGVWTLERTTILGEGPNVVVVMLKL